MHMDLILYLNIWQKNLSKVSEKGTLSKFAALCLAYVLAKEIYIEDMIPTITVIDKHVWRTTLRVAEQEKCR
jgi:hypothetical protein